MRIAKHRSNLLLAAGVLAALLPGIAHGQTVVSDFDSVAGWKGLVLDTQTKVQGSGSGLWSDHPAHPAASYSFIAASGAPLDLSDADVLVFSVHSEVANGAGLTLVFDSDNDEGAADIGWDYYSTKITVDWTGWRTFVLPKGQLSAARHPLGWHAIRSVAFNASGWDNTPQPDTVLRLDYMVGLRKTLGEVTWDGAAGPEGYTTVFTLPLRSPTGEVVDAVLTAEKLQDLGFVLSFSSKSVTLPATGELLVELEVTVPAELMAALPPLAQESIEVQVHLPASGLPPGVPADGVTLTPAVPLPPRPSPRVLLEQADFDRIAVWADAHPWAAGIRDAIVAKAAAFPGTFTAKYGTADWQVPETGGQWSLWYVCPVHNVSLSYKGGQSVCPVGEEEYTGWPYDDVVLTYQHTDLARAARDQGLAFRMTGDASHAATAAEILLAYAAAYPAYAIHDINGNPSKSGGRALAQTLDESVWAIDMAFAYDLIAGAGVLSEPEDATVRALLRQIHTTIARNNAGSSNWQSWHNAGMAAVGLALDDPILLAGPLGEGVGSFAWQMDQSVTADGFWYEGSAGYHFYALDALMRLARMGDLAGLGLHEDPALESLFRGPLDLAMPDSSLPPFNDSGLVKLSSYARFYEMATAWYGDPAFAGLLGARTSEEALFYGVEEPPKGDGLGTASVVLPDSGIGVLRARSQEGDARYAALDFGPHGGGHGHYDKLGIVTFSNGAMAALDPGTHSYATAVHKEWDKETVAHNTVVVDGVSQGQATGTLLGFFGLPDVSVVVADAGAAYPQAALGRTLVLTGDYLLDRATAQSADGAAHTFDWVYHQRGAVSVVPAGSPWAFPGAGAGYAYLTGVTRADTAGEVTADFEVAGSQVGSIWPSKPDIVASFGFTSSDPGSGSGAGLIEYAYGASGGYFLATLSAGGAPASAAPTELSLLIRGDGSGNTLALRVNDATNERFVKAVGPIDWVGWKAVTVTDPESWGSYLGDADGEIDLPVSSVSLEVSFKGADSGALGVDDVVLGYGDQGPFEIEDFEGGWWGTRLTLAGAPGTGVITGDGVGPSGNEPVPFVMLRRAGMAASFVALHEPYAPVPVGLGLEVSDAPEGVLAVRVEHPLGAFADRIVSSPDATGATVDVGPLVTDGRFAFVREVGGEPTRFALGDGTRLGLPGGPPRLIRSEAPIHAIQVDIGEGGRAILATADVMPEATLELLAPKARRLVVNGASVPFDRLAERIVAFRCADACVELEVAAGAPFAKAILYRKRSDGSFVRVADHVAGDDGQVRFAGLAPQGQYKVHVPVAQ